MTFASRETDRERRSFGAAMPISEFQHTFLRAMHWQPLVVAIRFN